MLQYKSNKHVKWLKSFSILKIINNINTVGKKMSQKLIFVTARLKKAGR